MGYSVGDLAQRLQRRVVYYPNLSMRCKENEPKVLIWVVCLRVDRREVFCKVTGHDF